MSDLFGVKGREWLRGLELPEVEDETVTAGLRHIEFLDAEIEQVERLIAKEALQSPQIKRLMTVPGVNVDPRGDLPRRGRRHPPLHRLPPGGRLHGP